MPWFLIALCAPALWSASNLIDKYLLERYFKDRSSGSLYLLSGATGLVAVTVILALHPSVLHVPMRNALVLVTGSIVGSGMLYCYLRAMRLADPSVVISLFQLIPVFSGLLAYVLLGEVLTRHQVLGSALIILAAIALSLDLAGGKVRLRAGMFGWMLVSCLCASINNIAFKYVGLSTGFLPAVFWDATGVTLVCLTLFAAAPIPRREFLSIFQRANLGLVAVLGLNETLNFVAMLIFYFAALLAPLELVQVVNGFQPVFVLVYGIILAALVPRLRQETLSRRHVAQKIAGIGIILAGAYLISK